MGSAGYSEATIQLEIPVGQIVHNLPLPDISRQRKENVSRLGDTAQGITSGHAASKSPEELENIIRLEQEMFRTSSPTQATKATLDDQQTGGGKIRPAAKVVGDIRGASEADDAPESAEVRERPDKIVKQDAELERQEEAAEVPHILDEGTKPISSSASLSPFHSPPLTVAFKRGRHIDETLQIIRAQAGRASAAQSRVNRAGPREREESNLHRNAQSPSDVPVSAEVRERLDKIADQDTESQGTGKKLERWEGEVLGACRRSGRR